MLLHHNTAADQPASKQRLMVNARGRLNIANGQSLTQQAALAGIKSCVK